MTRNSGLLRDDYASLGRVVDTTHFVRWMFICLELTEEVFISEAIQKLPIAARFVQGEPHLQEIFNNQHHWYSQILQCLIAP